MKKRFSNAWKAVKNFFSHKWVRRALVTVAFTAVALATAWAWSVGILVGWLALPTAAGVGLFMVATMESFNIFSAMNSSPWTAENFGADKKKAESCRKYVVLSIVSNEMLGVGASLLALNAWPFLGTTVASLYMYVIYQRALKKGMEAGNTGWTNMPEEAKVVVPA